VTLNVAATSQAVRAELQRGGTELLLVAPHLRPATQALEAATSTVCRVPTLLLAAEVAEDAALAALLGLGKAGTHQESEASLRALMDNSIQGIALVQGEHFKFVNRAWCVITGYGPEQTLGHPMAELYARVHPEDRERMHERKRRFERGEPVEEVSEIRLLRPNGEERWVLTASKDFSLGGEPGRLGMLVDVTDRKAAEARVVQLNRTYAVLSEINQLMVRDRQVPSILQGACRIAVAAGGFRAACIALVNQKSGQLELTANAGAADDTLQIIEQIYRGAGCAFTTAAVASKQHMLCNDIEHHELTAPWREAALARGYRAMAAFPLVLGDTCVGVLSLYAGQVDFFDAEELRLLDDLAQDISFALESSTNERKRLLLEEQVQKSQKMEAIGRLAGGIAHDFNNLLTIIHGNAALLRTLDDETERSDAIGEIVQTTERAAALTRQLLAFSRRQLLEPRPLDLNEVVMGMARMLKRILGEDVSLLLQTQPEPLVTRADPSMLDQVLLNLIVNARDAMPRGGELSIETGELELTAADQREFPDAAPGRHVFLRVTDSGGGIAPENLPRIYEPFFTTKEPGKGTGLGLATVFGIVQQHAGTLRVASALGRGTSFTVTLPRAPEAAPIGGRGEPAAPDGVGQRLLVVEDELSVRKFVKRLLVSHGYRVETAGSGPEALRLFEAQGGQIDLLLTDIVMPGGMSGVELGRALLVRKPELKVLYMSGYAGELQTGDQPLREGLNFLQKPFTPELLLSCVQRCLQSSTLTTAGA
jgi:PAS domain S-box-containing protein